MSKKKAPYRLLVGIKFYTLEKLAETLKVSKGTIRVSWRKMGLMPIALNRTPLLYNGQEVKDFLKNYYESWKKEIAINEFFCFKCQKAVKPKNSLLESFRDSKGRTSIKGKCESCEAEIDKKNISKKTTELLKKEYQVISQGMEIRCKTPRPSGKSRLEESKMERLTDSYLDAEIIQSENTTRPSDKSRLEEKQNDLFERM
ncbi:MAG: hypothetical protein ACTSXL_04205 [Alphaproteobacteria bacterium]